MSGLVHDHSQWPHSRWGADDQIGAGNLLTVERRLAALRSVQTGRLYDLSYEISASAPYLLPNQTPYLFSGPLKAWSGDGCPGECRRFFPGVGQYQFHSL